jgi:Tfp pilus assembly protein FimT
MFQGATQVLRDSTPPLPRRKLTRGYSTVELVFVIAVGMIVTAMALPIVKSSLQSFRVQSAVSSMSGAISSTRYHAIVDGCPYAVSFKKATNTYQVSSTVTGGACSATFTNIGSAVPFGNTSQIALSQDVAFQFSPGGSVQVTTGAATFNLSHLGTPITKTIQVSTYGSVTVQ